MTDEDPEASPVEGQEPLQPRPLMHVKGQSLRPLCFETLERFGKVPRHCIKDPCFFRRLNYFVLI